MYTKAVTASRWRCVVLAAWVAAMGSPAVTHAATFYVDPITGSASGDGSAGNPWRTIEEVIEANLIESTGAGVINNLGAPIKAGDTILLRSGYHGEVILNDYHNTEMITIAAEAGHTPQLRRIRVAPGRYWTFRGLTISPSLGPGYQKLTLVDFYSRFIGTCAYIVVEDCFIYSVLDTAGWSAGDWVSKACHGINLGQSGSHLTARNNRILNVAFGIYAQAYDSLAEYNEITNFSGDGIRATGESSVVQYNLIRNCYDVDDNHDDGIQGFLAYSPGTMIRDVVLRGNIIINRSDPNQPHQGSLQGIGCFDGPYKDWIVENNVVITDHWHGITFMGGEGCRVINNTVFSPWYNSGQSSMWTWILIDSYKSGAKSNDCVVRNNIAPQVLVSAADNNNATVDHNLTIPGGSDADVWFVDADSFDLRPASGSPAIDAGSSVDVPIIDADGFHRPIGGGWDVGAYEYDSLPPLMADAGFDQTVADVDGDGLESVTLDGSGSYCLSGTPMYLWTEDGTFVGSDAVVSAAAMVGEHTYTLKIFNGTGQEAIDEVTVTVEPYAAPTPGDADADGDVDLDDFVALKKSFGMSSGAQWSNGDFDADGDVDLDDFVILKDNLGS